MKYIHVRSLQKYHPGYTDRKLQWAKIFFSLVQGDPDTEMLHETDRNRLITLILLELAAQKPLPISNEYFIRKGFDLKMRPMVLTIEMLHKFIDVVTEDSKICVVDKSKNKRREDSVTVTELDFLAIWNKYPSKVGKKEAHRHFKTSVKTKQDLQDISTALSNYLRSERVLKGFIQNGSRWMNDWRSWLNQTPKKKPKGTTAQELINKYESEK